MGTAARWHQPRAAIVHCFRAFPTRIRPAPVLISRSSLPLSTITTLDCEIPAGGGSVRVIDPVQSELTVYVPIAVLDGMMVPFKLYSRGLRDISNTIERNRPAVGNQSDWT